MVDDVSVDDFESLAVIGKGGFGKVLKVRKKVSKLSSLESPTLSNSFPLPAFFCSEYTRLHSN